MEHLEKAHFIVDEMIMNGSIVEEMSLVVVALWPLFARTAPNMGGSLPRPQRH